MSEYVTFDIVCPNNHNQEISLTQKEYDQASKAGGLLFHCNTCDTDWTPSHEDTAKIHKAFAKNIS